MSPRGENDLETEIHLSTSGQLFREEAQAAFYDLLEKTVNVCSCISPQPLGQFLVFPWPSGVCLWRMR